MERHPLRGRLSGHGHLASIGPECHRQWNGRAAEACAGAGLPASASDFDFRQLGHLRRLGPRSDDALVPSTQVVGSWGCISAVDSGGRTIFVADAHRGEGKRFVVRADEKPTAFVELESAISHSRSYDRTALEVTKTLTAKPSAHSAV